MPQYYVHTEDLAEIGGFGNGYYDLADITATEVGAKTEFQFAHLAIPSQEKSQEQLESLGWTKLGLRFNQFHGPRYIHVYWKHRREFAGSEAIVSNHYKGHPNWHSYNGHSYDPKYKAPIRVGYSQFGCGFHLVKAATAETLTEHVLTTNWASIVQLADGDDKSAMNLLVKSGWKFIPESRRYWHKLLSEKDAALPENGGPDGPHYSTYPSCKNRIV